MIPLLLVFATFLFLTLVGQAVLSIIRPRLGILWGWFIAPTVGLSLLIVILTRLSVWGIPVRDSGPWLTLGLGVFTAAVLLWRRPTLPMRKLAPFFLLAVAYLAYTGWPLVTFGFNWISYGNDDMANYCLAADRFLDHGYYELPLQSHLEGGDYSQHYWFMHALQQIRPGSELTLAWMSSITGLKARQVFMPAILMLSMLQILALASVAIYRGRNRKLTLLAVFLFAVSPLFGLGTLYQLIAQVGGIALLLATSSVLLSAQQLTLRKALVAGLLTACLAILYPEVAPFVALSILVFAFRLRYTEPKLLVRYALFVAGVAGLTFVLIASNTYQFINTLVMQSVGSAGLGAMAEIDDQSGGLVLFPWTLVPSFIPMLFGLHPFGVVGVDPLISIQIVVGFIFLGLYASGVLRNIKIGAPIGYIGGIMAVLGAYLFWKGQDFGLFKLAMFAQPVIAFILADTFARWLSLGSYRARRWARIGLAVFVLCTIPSHYYYTDASRGTYGGGLTEIVGASRYGVSFDPPTDLKYDAIESDISNVVTAKMLSQYTRGWDTRFLSRSYMDNIANIAVLKFLRDPDPNLGPTARIVEKLSKLRWLLPSVLTSKDEPVPDYRVMTVNKQMSDPANDWTENSSRHLGYTDRLFVAVRSELDHFNKFNPGTGWSVQRIWQYKLESDVKDRLVFVHSFLGPHYYSSARFRAAFFQREAEPLGGGGSFHGTGRYTLFNVIKPSPNLRMIIDFTRTSLGTGRSKLPDRAVVIGEDDYPIPFVGHGSARVVTGPIKPEYFEGQAYLTVNINSQPAPIDKPKTGLMRLYGLKFNLDDRRLVGFTRDMSVITEEQYRQMKRPTKISEFPKDLYSNPGLEYSGIFEDGWMADDAFVKLGPSHPGQVLYFKGFVPTTPKFQSTGEDITISVNGKPTEIVNLKAGEFTLTRLIKEPAEVTSISMHFSGTDIYESKRDKRPVSAFVREISIGDLPDLTSFRKLTNQQGDRFDLKGIDDDGWLAKEAEFNAPVFSEFKVLKIDLEMPGWAPIASNQLDVTVNGSAIESSTVPRESYKSLYIPLQPGKSTKVALATSEVYPLPNDSRQRSYLLKNISFENISPTDLFTRGWHRNGYIFSINGVDGDGWVDRNAAFEFPATDKYKTAIISIIRFPARADLPLEVSVNGTVAEATMLALDRVERIEIPLSASRPTPAALRAPRNFPLTAPDTRERSFRIVTIDFE